MERPGGLMVYLPDEAIMNAAPSGVKDFGKRALVLLGLWLVGYYFLLGPHRVPDRWLSNFTGETTAWLASIWYQASPLAFVEKNNWACIVLNGQNVIRIGDACNALDLMMLNVGFILCIPTSKKRQLTFIIAGTLLLFLLNIIRCNAIIWLVFYKIEWVDVAHKFIFTGIVYCFIFAGWMLYTRNYHGRYEN